MPRYEIDDDFELSDFEDDYHEADNRDQWLGRGNLLLRRTRRRGLPTRVWLVLMALVAGIGSFVALVYVPQRMQDDAFCYTCHTSTPQHQTYIERSQASITGALPPDLASYHYQQIFNKGGSIRCISCHIGDNGVVHRAQTSGLSAWMTARWLMQRDDPRVEKTAISATVQIAQADGTTRTTTIWSNLLPEPGLEIVAQNVTYVITPSRRMTRTVGLPQWRAPELSNAGCVQCHQDTLLTAGFENHAHNMLPQSYALWKNGAKLLPPVNSSDASTFIAQGLPQLNTTLQCSGCHQTHRTVDANKFLDRTDVLPKACVQCHRESKQGPLIVNVNPEN